MVEGLNQDKLTVSCVHRRVLHTLKPEQTAMGEKRYMVSLQKALGRRLFLLGKTWRNKIRFLEFNHEVLGGLSMRDPRDTPQGREEI